MPCATARQRCWRCDWVLDLDVKAFFDTIDWKLMLKAVRPTYGLPMGVALRRSLAVLAHADRLYDDTEELARWAWDAHAVVLRAAARKGKTSGSPRRAARKTL
jgi:hypothetical protein